MIEIESPGVPIKAWIEGVPVEDDAKKQLQGIAKLPVVWPHVAVMPGLKRPINNKCSPSRLASGLLFSVAKLFAIES